MQNLLDIIKMIYDRKSAIERLTGVTPTARPISAPTARPTSAPTARPTARPTAVYVPRFNGDNIDLFITSVEIFIKDQLTSNPNDDIAKKVNELIVKYKKYKEDENELFDKFYQIVDEHVEIYYDSNNIWHNIFNDFYELLSILQDIKVNEIMELFNSSNKNIENYKYSDNTYMSITKFAQTYRDFLNEKIHPRRIEEYYVQFDEIDDYENDYRFIPIPRKCIVGIPRKNQKQIGYPTYEECKKHIPIKK